MGLIVKGHGSRSVVNLGFFVNCRYSLYVLNGVIFHRYSLAMAILETKSKTQFDMIPDRVVPENQRELVGNGATAKKSLPKIRSISARLSSAYLFFFIHVGR